MNIVIPDEIIQRANLTPHQFEIDIACYLYNKDIFSMGQARKFAGLDQISFQKELSARDYYIHYTEEDFKKDLTNIR